MSPSALHIHDSTATNIPLSIPIPDDRQQRYQLVSSGQHQRILWKRRACGRPSMGVLESGGEETHRRVNGRGRERHGDEFPMRRVESGRGEVMGRNLARKT